MSAIVLPSCLNEQVHCSLKCVRVTSLFGIQFSFQTVCFGYLSTDFGKILKHNLIWEMGKLNSSITIQSSIHVIAH